MIALHKVSIQVKTLSKKNPVPLGTSLDKIMGDFWVVVNNVRTSPAAYVLAPAQVRRLAHRGEKDGGFYEEGWGRGGLGVSPSFTL